MLYLFKKYLKRYWVYITLCIIFIFAQTLTELMLPNIMSDIVDVGIVNGDIPFILKKGGIMLAWAFGSFVAVVITSYCSSKATMGFGRDLRLDIFKKVESFSTYEFNQFGTSTLITRNTNDVQQLERVVLMFMTMLLFTPILLVGAIVMAFSTNAHLAWIACAAIPFLALTAFLIFRYAMPLVKSLQRKIDKLNLVTREGLTGIRVIRAFNKQKFEEERFAQANADLRNTNTKVGRTMAAMMPAATIILNAVVIALCWFGAINVQNASLQVGDLMAVIQYATMVLISTMMLSILFFVLPRAIAAADRIKAVLDAQCMVQDDPAAQMPPVVGEQGVTQEGPGIIGRITGDHTRASRIVFEHVSYRYPDAKDDALIDLNFSFEPCTTTVIIGSTGSGKSTLVGLIQRFMDPTEGRITIDGFDIRHLPQAELRKRLSYVPQKAVLFSGTIADNLRYGKDDASQEELERAAKIAQAHDFIMEREGGYEGEIGQDGGGLSGGQRQRLSIARALVRNALLYIFDDSFSALDFKTDGALRAALNTEQKGTTKVIIAQRVSQAMDADKVIVLEEGRVVAQGVHEELLHSCDVYRDIALSQLSPEDLGLANAESVDISSFWSDDDEDDGRGATLLVKGHVTEEPCQEDLSPKGGDQ